MECLRTSAESRALDGAGFDVAVIGGGINGVAIARECARSGRRTLLIEQQDFSSGTTSRATRLIHGGLRYLEHRDLALVRESLRERERLLRDHPHLVRRIEFLLALPQGARHSALTIRAGLWLYHRMGAQLNYRNASDRELEAALNYGQRWTVFSYSDAQCEFPERLVAEWLIDAISAGAVAFNHVELLAITVCEGAVCGLRLRDSLNGTEFSVAAHRVINATGPWVDRVLQLAPLSRIRRLVGGVRGSHIIVSRFPGCPTGAVYTEASDGRPFFVVPWNGMLLVGTTEISDSSDPANTQPNADEVDYLQQNLLRLFPAAAGVPIQYAYAGIRPLPYSPHLQAGDITRRQVVHDHGDDGAHGLISLVGGKLTTALSAARACLAAAEIRSVAEVPALLAHAPADGIASSLLQWAQSAAARTGISIDSAYGIAEWHGRYALCVASLAASAPELREPICSHSPHLVAEAVFALRHERAATLADVLLRRVPVALGECWSAACTATAAQRIAKALGWNESFVAQAIGQFEAERASFLHRADRMPNLPPRAESAA